MAGNEDPMKNLGAAVHGSTAAETAQVLEEFKMEEEKEEADLMCGGLLPLTGKQNGNGEVKDTTAAAKRKADDSEVASSDKKAEIKWVEMPSEYMAWVLAQTREEGLIAKVVTNEAWKEDFFAFQEWVRDTYDQNGRVMVPEEFFGPNPFGLQDRIDEAWEKGKRELEMADECPPSDSEDDTAAAMPSD